MANELKSLTLNGKKYDSFIDQEARKNAGGGTSIDVTAQVGQTIVVKEVDANGKPTAWESADYQPRTHWSEVVTILPETTVEIDAEQGIGVIPHEFSVVGGKEYTVVYNGVEYTDCECTEVEGMFAIGNLGAIVEGFPVTAHPFAIAYGQIDSDENENPILGWMFAPLDGSTSVTLSIIEESVTQIPEKYIPKPYVYEIDDEQFEFNGTSNNGYYIAKVAECPVSLLKAIMDGSPVFVNKKYVSGDNPLNDPMVRRTISPATWACSYVSGISNLIENADGEYIPSEEIEPFTCVLYFRGESGVNTVFDYIIRFVKV